MNIVKLIVGAIMIALIWIIVDEERQKKEYDPSSDEKIRRIAKKIFIVIGVLLLIGVVIWILVWILFVWLDYGYALKRI